MADDLVESLLEDFGQPRALLLVLEVRFVRIDVHRQLSLAPEVVERVLIRRHDPLAAAAEALGQRVDEARRVGSRSRRSRPACRQTDADAPTDRLAVLAPVAAVGPARQRLAGIPFALAVVQERAGAKRFFSRLISSSESRPSSAPQPRCSTRAVHVVDGDEGRLAAHGEADVVSLRSASKAWPSASISAHCSSV
jgi:hypothetical protein